ncbi:hypothetical protein MUG91_G47n171 [Manis pentadactyla]|nr:hypothetical protein MUG91_G47n171 [Manis pentadactyla]
MEHVQIVQRRTSADVFPDPSLENSSLPPSPRLLNPGSPVTTCHLKAGNIPPLRDCSCPCRPVSAAGEGASCSLEVVPVKGPEHPTYPGEKKLYRTTAWSAECPHQAACSIFPIASPKQKPPLTLLGLTSAPALLTPYVVTAGAQELPPLPPESHSASQLPPHSVLQALTLTLWAEVVAHLQLPGENIHGCLARKIPLLDFLAPPNIQETLVEAGLE